ncbi:MAG: P-II family nitrogen regulator [Planctomycetes bacterium]|nr:P-II family nitrogen regulator [Planctomycetota bacterium]
MKLIIAIIRPERLEAVQLELQAVLDEKDDYRITVETVEGHGRQEGEVEVFRGTRVRPRLIEKLKITLGVNDAYAEPAVQAILKGARTGKVGDGKVFIVPLEDVVRIRTGERGGKAI